MWKHLVVSLAILTIVVPPALLLITYNKYTSVYSEPKVISDTVKDSLYVYHYNGAILTLKNNSSDKFDANKVILTYQPPGAEKAIEFCIRLDDIELFIKAIRNFKFEESKKLRRIYNYDYYYYKN